MIGAIIGDIVGSKYEFNNIRTKKFPLFSDGCDFTDDTVMTVAVHNALKTYDETKSIEMFQEELVWEMRRLGRMFPNRGYGGRFGDWIWLDDPKPYNSFGNGSAMRVSPVSFYASSLEETLMLAKASAEVTHNHPEGIKGAQAVAAVTYLAKKQGWGKERIRNYVEGEFYKLDFTVDEIRNTYEFNETCQGSVPQAIECFLEGDNYEDVIRNCISIGGDCDTTAAMAGGMAEAFYGVPGELIEEAFKYIEPLQRQIK